MSLLSRFVQLFRPTSRRGQRTPAGEYWQRRRQMRYYAEVLRLARKHAPQAESVLDVGPNGTPLVCELGWIPSKTVIDLGSQAIPGATCLQGDFLKYEPQRPFDLVLCLQVLEHVGPAREFAQRLLGAGRLVIVSVPYRWPAGSCQHHVQDPVDEEKLRGWMEQSFVEHKIIRDGARDRLIAVLEGKAQRAASAARRAA
jgi:hypothetical protein